MAFLSQLSEEQFHAIFSNLTEIGDTLAKAGVTFQGETSLDKLVWKRVIETITAEVAPPPGAGKIPSIEQARDPGKEIQESLTLIREQASKLVHYLDEHPEFKQNALMEATEKALLFAQKQSEWLLEQQKEITPEQSLAIEQERIRQWEEQREKEFKEQNKQAERSNYKGLGDNILSTLTAIGDFLGSCITPEKEPAAEPSKLSEKEASFQQIIEGSKDASSILRAFSTLDKTSDLLQSPASPHVPNAGKTSPAQSF